MPVIDVGIRPGDHKDLKQIGRPTKEVAGILLEQAIRREADSRESANPKSAA